MNYRILAAAALMPVPSVQTFAQSNEYMPEDCTAVAQSFFVDWEARAEVKTEGQRTDRTRPVNGTIYLETRSEDFQCSYNRKGTTLVDFYAEGKSHNHFVKTGKSPHAK